MCGALFVFPGRAGGGEARAARGHTLLKTAISTNPHPLPRPLLFSSAALARAPAAPAPAPAPRPFRRLQPTPANAESNVRATPRTRAPLFARCARRAAFPRPNGHYFRRPAPPPTPSHTPRMCSSVPYSYLLRTSLRPSRRNPTVLELLYILHARGRDSRSPHAETSLPLRWSPCAAQPPRAPELSACSPRAYAAISIATPTVTARFSPVARAGRRPACHTAPL